MHEEHHLDLMELIRLIQRRYDARCVAWTQQESVELISWSPPAEGTIKINYDAAFNNHWISAAAVCRNWKGDILKARTCRLPGAEVIKGEAWAARLACSLVEEYANCDIIIEGDAQALVPQVLDIATTPG